RLLDSRGATVEHPFLELAEELWDYSGTRFTIFFDPGRIKRGLKPRELFGPALLENHQYTLVISQNWRDARGQPLRSEHRKRFRVTAPDDKQPNPRRWKLKLPPAGSLQPLTVVFDEPLDQAMLERVLRVHTRSGRNIAGEINIQNHETEWLLAPRTAWQPGVYELVIDTDLEDRAGNSIARPFEVDRLRRVQQTIKTRTVSRSFVIPPT
ncbi:MAG: Ig-like domain-containing protein, partial [Planctomycetaceae bacterium]